MTETPPASSQASLPYKEKIRAFSDALVELQRPIRVLDAVNWPAEVEDRFFARKAKELPEASADLYARRPLGYDPIRKAEEARALAKAIRAALGESDALAALMAEIAEEYAFAAEMLAARGTKRFYEISRRLYGSPKDPVFDDSSTVLSQGRVLYDILAGLRGKELGMEYPKAIPAEEAMRLLQERFERSFLRGRVEVKISDGIVADAAAGASEIKLKEGATFSSKDIDVFEVHEGWVHVATTLNGRAQRTATFLSKGPPRCAATQEGLAILVETLTFSSYPRRARTINDRLIGIDMAEDGADFLDVYGFYLNEGYGERDAFRNGMRVFRGGVVAGGAPFTKDISYGKGFLEDYNFMRAAIRRGRPELIPFLFAGKMNVADVPMLFARGQEGIVDPPELLPPHFEDLNGLAVWMSFSNYLSSADLGKAQSKYDAIFERHL